MPFIVSRPKTEDGTMETTKRRKARVRKREMKKEVEGVKRSRLLTVEAATTFTVVSQQETPTHLRHNQAVPLKMPTECSHSDDYTVISVKCTHTVEEM